MRVEWMLWLALAVCMMSPLDGAPKHRRDSEDSEHDPEPNVNPTSRNDTSSRVEPSKPPSNVGQGPQTNITNLTTTDRTGGRRPYQQISLAAIARLLYAEWSKWGFARNHEVAHFFAHYPQVVDLLADPNSVRRHIDPNLPQMSAEQVVNLFQNMGIFPRGRQPLLVYFGNGEASVQVKPGSIPSPRPSINTDRRPTVKPNTLKHTTRPSPPSSKGGKNTDRRPTVKPNTPKHTTRPSPPSSKGGKNSVGRPTSTRPRLG